VGIGDRRGARVEVVEQLLVGVLESQGLRDQFDPPLPVGAAGPGDVENEHGRDSAQGVEVGVVDAVVGDDQIGFEGGDLLGVGFGTVGDDGNVVDLLPGLGRHRVLGDGTATDRHDSQIDQGLRRDVVDGGRSEARGCG